MKTLYININGEDIQSTENIIVVGRPEDAIINKFFFELGKETLKGVVAPGVTNIKKKDVVTAFKTHDEKSFYRILDQWDTLKQELLGENPSGSRTVKLPDEYISWLQNSSQPAYSEIAKALYKRGGSVEVSINKIYKNAIGIIVNNIEPENCKGCGQFVVNDDAVTDDSAITASIQEIMPQIAFVPFEDFGKCPKCGKNPCECKPEEPVCPKCGKNPCECIQFKDPLFPIDNIVLGVTSLNDIIKDEKIDLTYHKNKKHWFAEHVSFSKGLIYIYDGYYEIYFTETAFKYTQFFGNEMISHLVADNFSKFPLSWTEYFGFSIHSTLQNVKKILESKDFEDKKFYKVPYDQESDYKYLITFFIESKKYFVSLLFGEDHEKGGLVLYSLSLELTTCPYCKNENVRYSISFGYDINMSPNPCIRHYCEDCNRRWASLDLDIKCSDCGSYGTTYRTKKGHLKCTVCGHSF